MMYAVRCERCSDINACQSESIRNDRLVRLASCNSFDSCASTTRNKDVYGTAELPAQEHRASRHRLTRCSNGALPKASVISMPAPYSNRRLSSARRGCDVATERWRLRRCTAAARTRAASASTSQHYRRHCSTPSHYHLA